MTVSRGKDWAQSRLLVSAGSVGHALRRRPYFRSLLAASTAARVRDSPAGRRWRLPFDLQPVLTGELLSLRPLREDDFQDLYAVASDPLIWAQHPSSDRHKTDVFKDFFREAMESGGALIAHSTDGRVIGSSRFNGYDAVKSEIEIGWTFLARSCWGGTYNREMKELMLRHAFRFVDRVVFIVGPQNLRSQKALEKIGGLPAGWRPDSSGRECLVYEIRASAFLSNGGQR
jgi:RimJ/RimL family protein N-acetyltransferase